MSEAVKAKIRQLYAFLREANQLRSRPIRILEDQVKVVRLKNMPSYPGMQIFNIVEIDGGREVPEALIRIKRPALTKCPPPPKSLLPWLLPRWDDPTRRVEFAKTQNQRVSGNTVTVHFHNSQLRLDDAKRWLDQRTAWADPEISARKAMHFFEEFYDLHSALEKDGEELELVLADGHLLWSTTSSIDGEIIIHHPVLSKRVELRFDPSVPEFTVHDTDREAELYERLFTDITEVSPVALRNRKTELGVLGCHPLSLNDTNAFLKSFIQTLSPLKGEFIEGVLNDEPATVPRLYRSPVLALRKRLSGLVNCVDTIIDDIDQQSFFPPALQLITGSADEWKSIVLSSSQANNATNNPSLSNPDDILLASASNEEQQKIIQRLEYSGAVIVQGPPGTGKTHTIGNLIGHLLASGKSILVTAQTTKALRVVRDKIPPKLQPLAVSVLGSDQDARRQLEASVGSITERLTTDSANALVAKGRQIEEERKELLNQKHNLVRQLREALETEYKPISIGNDSFLPSDAARFVSKNINSHDWIPAPVKPGAELDMSDAEVARLYALNNAFTPQEELDAADCMPDLAKLPSDLEFRRIISEYQTLTTSDFGFGKEWWRSNSGSSSSLDDLADAINIEFSDDLLQHTWRPHAIVAGIHGGTQLLVWQKFASSIEEAAEANARYALYLHHRAQLAEAIPLHSQVRFAGEICEFLERGGKLTFLQLITRTDWRAFIQGSVVVSGQPSHKEHFFALRNLCQLEQMRMDLELSWNRLIGSHIDSSFDSLGNEPELICRAFLPEIQRCLSWYSSVWEPLAVRLRSEGLKLDALLASLPREASEVSEYLVVEKLVQSFLMELLGAEAGRRRLRELETHLSSLSDLVISTAGGSIGQCAVSRLVGAINTRNPNSYAQTLEYVRRLNAVKPWVYERDGLLKKLSLVAPGWADQIRHRIPPHDKASVPGDPVKAWKWRQLNEALTDRDNLDAQQLQGQVERNRESLHHVTEALIDAKAWGSQLERLPRQPFRSASASRMGGYDPSPAFNP